VRSIVPSIPPPTPAGVAAPARRYPAPQLKLSGRAAEVLADLRAADTSSVVLGMRRPVVPAPRPLPTRSLIERLTAVSTAMHADYGRHLDTLAVLDDIAAALTEHPEAMATPSHPGIRLGLRRAFAELAALAPVDGAQAQKAQVA